MDCIFLNSIFNFLIWKRKLLPQYLIIYIYSVTNLINKAPYARYYTTLVNVAWWLIIIQMWIWRMDLDHIPEKNYARHGLSPYIMMMYCILWNGKASGISTSHFLFFFPMSQGSGIIKPSVRKDIFYIFILAFKYFLIISSCYMHFLLLCIACIHPGSLDKKRWIERGKYASWSISLCMSFTAFTVCVGLLPIPMFILGRDLRDIQMGFPCWKNHDWHMSKMPPGLQLSPICPHSSSSSLRKHRSGGLS